MKRNFLYLLFLSIMIAGCARDTQPLSRESQSRMMQPLHTPPVKSTSIEPTVLPKWMLLPPKMEKQLPEETPITPIMPDKLEIPAINLHTAVEPVGVLQNGQMGVPTEFDRVGILSPWTKPGDIGDAVIAGHFDHYTGPAVFYNLRKLKPGDDIFVSNQSGIKLRFGSTE